MPVVRGRRRNAGHAEKPGSAVRRLAASAYRRPSGRAIFGKAIQRRPQAAEHAERPEITIPCERRTAASLVRSGLAIAHGDRHAARRRQLCSKSRAASHLQPAGSRQRRRSTFREKCPSGWLFLHNRATFCSYNRGRCAPQGRRSLHQSAPTDAGVARRCASSRASHACPPAAADARPHPSRFRIERALEFTDVV